MGARFWIRRFVVVFIGAFVAIGVGQLLRGRTATDAAMHGLVWAAVSAIVFTTARVYQSRRGLHCAICRDTPETRSTPR
jgi:hypothetical protein